VLAVTDVETGLAAVQTLVSSEASSLLASALNPTAQEISLQFISEARNVSLSGNDAARTDVIVLSDGQATLTDYPADIVVALDGVDSLESIPTALFPGEAGRSVTISGQVDQVFLGSGNDTLAAVTIPNSVNGGEGLDRVFLPSIDQFSLSSQADSVAVVTEGTQIGVVGVETVVSSSRLALPTLVASVSVQATVDPFNDDLSRSLPSEVQITDDFDEAFYLSAYRDVKLAVDAGAFQSGLDHYLIFGMGEGRVARVAFDSAFYAAGNPDVTLAVQNGFLLSHETHFGVLGARENRAPNALFDEAFYRQQNPDVDLAVDQGVFVSGRDHYTHFGWREGRLPGPLFDGPAYLSEQNLGGSVSPLEHFIDVGAPLGFSAPMPNLDSL